MSTRSVHLLVHGLVQGVSYRASAQDTARSLALMGWVRNVPNGDVEAHAEGEAAAVERFISWCRTGPAEARVTGVEVNDEPPQALSSFEVRR